MWMVDSKWNNMTNIPITKEEIAGVFPKVAGIIADALPCEIERVTPEASLINDLGAQSIDFLDIVFRLERAFKVKIPRGKLIEEARGALTPEEFEQRGVVSEPGLERLRTFLSEVPAERFVAPLKVAEIPRLFTAETFCKLVIRQQQRAAAAAKPGVTVS
jgi:acyl carrier protein